MAGEEGRHFLCAFPLQELLNQYLLIDTQPNRKALTLQAVPAVAGINAGGRYYLHAGVAAGADER